MFKRNILSIGICLSLSIVIVFAVKGFNYFTNSHGYDYDSIIKKGYDWTGPKTGENIIPSINKMVLPSHILINSKGNVIKTFPGTNKEKSVREQMANQIVKEVIEEQSILDTKRQTL